MLVTIERAFIISFVCTFTLALIYDCVEADGVIKGGEKSNAGNGVDVKRFKNNSDIEGEINNLQEPRIGIAGGTGNYTSDDGNPVLRDVINVILIVLLVIAITLAACGTCLISFGIFYGRVIMAYDDNRL